VTSASNCIHDSVQVLQPQPASKLAWRREDLRKTHTNVIANIDFKLNLSSIENKTN